MNFKLLPHLRTKGNQTTWALQVRPYRRICKYQVVKHLKSLYPDLQINRVYTVKSLKRQVVVLETNQVPYWKET